MSISHWGVFFGHYTHSIGYQPIWNPEDFDWDFLA